MAKAATNGLAGKLLGASMGLAAAFAPMAGHAQDAAAVANEVPVGWTAETWELHQAGQAVSTYAKETPNGVGILLHIGDDLRGRAQAAADKHSVPYEHALNVMTNKISEVYGAQFAEHGVETQLFPRANLDATATLMTYHIGEIIYQDANNEPLLDLKTASEDVSRVVEALSYINQRAQLQLDQPQPEIGG